MANESPKDEKSSLKRFVFKYQLTECNVKSVMFFQLKLGAAGSPAGRCYESNAVSSLGPLRLFHLLCEIPKNSTLGKRTHFGKSTFLCIFLDFLGKFINQSINTLFI